MLTHQDAERTDTDLYGSDDVEDLLGAEMDEPVVAFEGEGEGEEVLEDDEAGEALDCEIACDV